MFGEVHEARLALAECVQYNVALIKSAVSSLIHLYEYIYIVLCQYSVFQI